MSGREALTVASDYGLDRRAAFQFQHVGGWYILYYVVRQLLKTTDTIPTRATTYVQYKP